MSDLADVLGQAVEAFGTRVRAVGDDQWDQPTPNTEWNVKALLNHLVSECLWMSPLLAGKTIAEVGDELDGDLLGDDPKAAWEGAAAAARAAVGRAGALDGVVHVSFGDIPAEEYVKQVATDHVIHAWDLARSVRGEERLDPDLVAFAFGYLAPQVEEWRAAGAFGPKVDTAPDADEQTRLLALTGRAV